VGARQWSVRGGEQALPVSTGKHPGEAGLGVAVRGYGRGGRVVLLPDEEYTWMFTVDMETTEVERVAKRNWRADRVFPYELPWPPSFNACV
jgi:hypothetical protein